jgi:adenosine deaminase
VSEPTVTAEWITALPKAEVHVHIEGCIPPETIGVDEDAFEFVDLAGFLDYLDRSCRLVTEAEQLEQIACGLVTRAARSGVRHVDAIFNPEHWPVWWDHLDRYVAALDAGLAAGETDHGVTSDLCLSLKRTQAPSRSVELVDWLLEHRPPRIVGLSVDGNEAAAGRTADRFAPLYQRARQAGLRTCAHAGESSGPEGVLDAVEILQAERIDHGIRAIEDPTVVDTLRQRAVPLDVCPTSNVRLGVVPSLAVHPVEQLRRAGVRVSLNTDDPLLFGTDVAGEYSRAATAFGWGRAELAALAQTSIEASFASDDRRRELLGELDRFRAL